LLWLGLIGVGWLGCPVSFDFCFWCVGRPVFEFGHFGVYRPAVKFVWLRFGVGVLFIWFSVFWVLLFGLSRGSVSVGFLY